MHRAAGIVLLTCLTLAACSGAASPASRPAPSSQPMNAANLHGTWRLTRLGEQELPHDARLTLQFEPGGRMGGFAGVNRYFGTYRADDVGGLRFGDIGATRRAGPPQDMQRERQILGALSTVTSYILEDDTLRLTDGHDTLLVGERTR